MQTEEEEEEEEEDNDDDEEEEEEEDDDEKQSMKIMLLHVSKAKTTHDIKSGLIHTSTREKYSHKR